MGTRRHLLPNRALPIITEDESHCCVNCELLLPETPGKRGRVYCGAEVGSAQLLGRDEARRLYLRTDYCKSNSKTIPTLQEFLVGKTIREVDSDLIYFKIICTDESELLITTSEWIEVKAGGQVLTDSEITSSDSWLD